MPGAEPRSIDVALELGGIVAPPSAEVLGVAHDAGIDDQYRFALGLPPGDVAVLMAESGFTTPLTPDAGPYNDVVDGFDLSTATDVVATEDRLEPEADRTQTVYRKVVVDRSDPARSVAHFWVFTT